MRKLIRTGIFLACAFKGYGQLSISAYRGLGQPDLRQNGINRVQGVEFFGPGGVALDPRGGQIHFYVADTSNSRILAWQDIRSYQVGDAPTLVLGQPTPLNSTPLGIGEKGFNVPAGMAVDPNTGNLYVADSANSRVLRFASPFANPKRIEPDAVYGQPDFTTRRANSLGINKGSMNGPLAVAFDSSRNLWVADSGNNRVLRFPAGVLDSATPPQADIVIGQPDFGGNAANRGGSAPSSSGLAAPFGIAFDSQNNLYVSDRNNARVLKFSAPLGPANPDPAATAVYGQPDFVSKAVSAQASGTTLTTPAGLTVDASGALYVAVPNDNRIMVFPAGSTTANRVLGQVDFTSTAANANVFPLAASNTLYTPYDVRVDANGVAYIADTGNNRVVAFPSGSKAANQVWGQIDFASNGVNQIKAGGMNHPAKIVIDYSQSPFPLYVADTNNNRVLIWKDAIRFRSGDPADLVIGQPDLRTGVANVDTRGSLKPSRTSLAAPRGMALDSAGNLYVADTGNHRVLRYPRPVNQAGRITPDLVIGQADFNSADSAAVTASSLKTPGAVAVGPNGNLFVADTGNNRVLEFAASAGNQAVALRVYGQPNFTSSPAPSFVSAQTLASPRGLVVDRAFNMYVADAGANRVLIFPNTQTAPSAGMAAAFVIGQDQFNSVGSNSGTALHAPVDVALDSRGTIYVSDSGFNRFLGFSPLVFLPTTGATALGVLGQSNLQGSAPNWNSVDGLATPEGLSGVDGIFMDRQDTAYLADSGNNRIIQFLKPITVVNSAHFQIGVPVAQGGIASLFGTGLSVRTESAAQTPLPNSLADREIVVNDEIRAALLYMSPTQSNFQVPSSAPAAAGRMAVRLAGTGELVAGGSTTVGAAGPGLFTMTQNGQGQSAAVNQDGKVNSTANPAARGSIVSLFGTGQGQVNPPVADGVPAPSGSLSNTVAVPTSDGNTCLASQPSVCVAIGTTFGDIQFSGLAPGYVGLWQINVKIPQDAPTGDAVNVRVVIGGFPSNIVTLAIR